MSADSPADMTKPIEIYVDADARRNFHKTTLS